MEQSWSSLNQKCYCVELDSIKNLYRTVVIRELSYLYITLSWILKKQLEPLVPSNDDDDDDDDDDALFAFQNSFYIKYYNHTYDKWCNSAYNIQQC